MIPKFRVWIKEEKCFADYIETIRYYAKEIDLCWGGICESDCFDFEDVIFTQSTGLKDKNDKEIFEGDVVRQVRTQPTMENEIITGVVTIIEGAWLIMNDCEQLASYVWSETDENEIIGNIYENLEFLEDIMNPEIIDNINKPSHYQGVNGLEAIDVVHNFVRDLSGASVFFWGNAIKYMLRFQKKNGLEDLKKARKNLDWLIEEMEHEN